MVVPGRMRRTIAALAAAAAGAALISTATAPAGAAVAIPTWQAISTPEWDVDHPTSLVSAAGKLFVADGTGVDVLTEAGALVTTIGGFETTGDSAASADGSRVVVASPGSATLSIIDTSTLTVVSQLTVGECPADLAFRGSALYYSYGCTTAAINHIDVVAGTVHALDAPDASGLGSPPLSIAVDGDQLYAYGTDGVLHGWPIGADGLGTHRSVETGGPGGSFAVRDGVVVMPYGSYSAVIRYDGTAMTSLGTWNLPSWAGPPTFNPSGTRLSVPVYGPELITLNTATGAIVGKASDARVKAHSIVTSTAYSSDGKVAFVITEDGSATRHNLVASSVDAPQKVSLALTVAKPATPAGRTTFTLKGTPGRVAVLKLRYRYQSPSTWASYSVPLGADGVASISLLRPYSGYAYARIEADVLHGAAQTATASISIKALITTKLSAGYKVVGGVTYYRSGGAAKQYAHIEPRRGRQVQALLKRWSPARRAWVTVGSADLYSNSYGNVATVLGDFPKGVTYRVTFVFPGDYYNAASSATTKSFRIG
jgi:YVTN family beta-propeller protein